MTGNRARRAFTSTDLVAAVVCVVFIATLAFFLFLPSQAGSGSVPSLKDKTQLKQIHAAMLIFANDNNGRLPTPGLMNGSSIGEEALSESPETHDFTLNHTAPLFSSLISEGYFGTELVISPREINPAVLDAVDFNFDAYQPSDGIFWDSTFTANVGDPEIGSNVSYAHLSLCGDRWLKHWRNDGPPATPMLGNRGTKNGEYDTDNYYKSPTLEFHGPRDQWVGNLVFADNHVETTVTFFPDLIRFRFDGEGFDRPDNIYVAEFAHPDGNEAAADAWLSISIGSTAVSVDEVFDSLLP